MDKSGDTSQIEFAGSITSMVRVVRPFYTNVKPALTWRDHISGRPSKGSIHSRKMTNGPALYTDGLQHQNMRRSFSSHIHEQHELFDKDLCL